MRLNAKIGLILILPMLILFGLLAVLLRSEVLTRFIDLERRELLQHHDRLTQAVDAELDSLRRLTRDWAYFDETFNFVAGTNPEWVESNFTATTFDNLQLDGILVFDQNGALVSGFAFDKSANRLTAVAEDLVAAVAALLAHPLRPQEQGVLRHGERVLQLALSEIRDSEGEAASNGRLVMMRYLDQGRVDALAQRIRLQLRFTPLSQLGDSAADQRLLEGVARGGPWLQLEGTDTIASYSLLDDLLGQPTLVMQLTAPRQIYLQGRDALRDLLLFALAAILLLVIATYFAIRWSIVSRLKGMARRLREIGDESNPRERLRFRGRDEISQVAGSINQMLEALQRAERRRRDAQERQRELNAVLIGMATNDSILDGRIETLLEVLRFALARGPGVSCWSLWFDDELQGMHCLGAADSRCAAALDQAQIDALLRAENRQEQAMLRTAEDAATPALLFPFSVEGRVGAVVVLLDAYQAPGDAEQNFIIGAAQLVEHAVLANRLATREQSLRVRAEVDPLTGLANRAAFDRELQLRLSTLGQEGQLGLLFIDLDRFKPVNDRYGHAAGDALLIEVGQRLRARLRTGDMVARMGGDEFTILLRNLKSVDDAGRVADKVLQVMAEPFSFEGQPLDIGCSIGVACAPLDGLSSAELVHAADQAMYRAKQAGRGAWCAAHDHPPPVPA